VNVSTDGGARVEIKGAQDLKMLPKYVETEEKRQLALVKLLAELRARGALPVKKHAADATKIFHGTKAAIIAAGLKAGAIVLAQKLPLHKGLLGRELQHGRRYGTELSDYAKLAGVKGIIHSDENMEKYGITRDELSGLGRELAMGEEDAFVLVVAPKAQAEQAMHFVIGRADMDYVPKETRRANPDGTSSFMRPLPGRARLYPETDVPPIPLTRDLLESIEKTESLEHKKEKLEKMLNREMAGRVLKSRHLHLFERLTSTGVEPMLAATTLEETVVSLRREGVDFADLEKTLGELFHEFKKGTFVKAAIPEVLKGMAKGARAEAVLKVYRLQRITGKELEKIADECGHDMKAVMQKYRLQVDPQEVSILLALKKKAKETRQN
jgi:glutamyl-tRNA(Gln) amidotransferase subunit E